MNKGGSPPATPDYAAQANAQGAANTTAAVNTGAINNPNVISPYGTTTYQSANTKSPAAYRSSLDQALADAQKGSLSWGGGDQTWRNQFLGQDYGSEKAAAYFNSTNAAAKTKIDAAQRQIDLFNQTGEIPSDNPNRPTVIQTFSPEQQALYDQQVGNQQELGNLAKQGLTAAQGIVGTPLTYSGVPAAPGDYSALRSKVIDAMMARPNQDIAVNRDNTNSNLIAAGIRPGSTAYDNTMRGVDRQQTDAEQQAIINAGNQTQQAYGMDMQSRQQGLAEQLAQRQVPLNEITALMSGSQVSNPFQMPGYAQNSNAQPAPVYDAGQSAGQYGTDVYNAQQARNANTQSGLYGLGGTAVMGGLMLF